MMKQRVTTKEEILELCKRLDISASHDDDILSDDDITFIESDDDRRRITVSKNWKEGNGYE